MPRFVAAAIFTMFLLSLISVSPNEQALDSVITATPTIGDVSAKLPKDYWIVTNEALSGQTRAVQLALPAHFSFK